MLCYSLFNLSMIVTKILHLAALKIKLLFFEWLISFWIVSSWYSCLWIFQFWQYLHSFVCPDYLKRLWLVDEARSFLNKSCYQNSWSLGGDWFRFWIVTTILLSSTWLLWILNRCLIDYACKHLCAFNFILNNIDRSRGQQLFSVERIFKL